MRFARNSTDHPDAIHSPLPAILCSTRSTSLMQADCVLVSTGRKPATTDVRSPALSPASSPLSPPKYISSLTPPSPHHFLQIGLETVGLSTNKFGQIEVRGARCRASSCAHAHVARDVSLCLIAHESSYASSLTHLIPFASTPHTPRTHAWRFADQRQVRDRCSRRVRHRRLHPRTHARAQGARPSLVPRVPCAPLARTILFVW